MRSADSRGGKDLDRPRDRLGYQRSDYRTVLIAGAIAQPQCGESKLGWLQRLDGMGLFDGIPLGLRQRLRHDRHHFELLALQVRQQHRRQPVQCGNQIQAGRRVRGVAPGAVGEPCDRR
ncbi:hypothetical protein NIIDMKKI_34440 [Mycobacterium kansasii]|uniref:Uncharacterized protein n=1 Tax=Mycobacterium kansasii TaxID=1768 RepID=A0A7G1II13_MYCKA|nr:hypothetical protein NIIDMKKI_34440 [Mycobacterium kansasii]